MRRFWLLRTLLAVAATALLALAAHGTRFEDDPIRALTHPDPARAALFDRYQASSFFRDRIFVESSGLDGAGQERLEAALRAAGYQEEGLVERPATAGVLALAGSLPPEQAGALLEDAAVARRAEEALALASLPGGEAFLRELQSDPLGLAPALLARLAPRGGQGGLLLRAYRSPRPLDYQRVGPAYDALVALGGRVHFIGADFFALENYRAVKHDLVLCSSAGLALNLLIFFFFTSRWALLGLLFLGSLLSYLTGVLTVRVVYGEVLALVLAYTSTFVGFNNESLVHLAGIEAEHRRRSLLGVWSAIGTTVIGFLVLLVGRSVMVRQLALASLGGLAGFLLFLVPFRRALSAVRFRALRWPVWTVPPGAVLGACVASVLVVAAAGVPPIATRIESFRYQTPALDAQVAWFSRQLEAVAAADVVAVPAAGSAQATLAALQAAGAAAPGHPLAAFRGAADQARTLALLRAGYGGAVARLQARLQAGGLRIELPDRLPEEVAPLDDWTFLERLGAVGPLRWCERVGEQRYLLAGLRPGAPPVPGAFALTPRRYYDDLLGTFSREIGLLFLAGLAVMAGYLLVLQRSAARVLYVFAPLFLGTAVFAAWARWTGSTVHIVHVIGFSLVIALAIDYTAVAVSSDHRDVELSKVLLTGASTLATFGVLLLAHHPVLRELGATVAVGCGLSLAFALLLRLPAREEGAP